jgi:hypothetical protein
MLGSTEVILEVKLQLPTFAPRTDGIGLVAFGVVTSDPKYPLTVNVVNPSVSSLRFAFSRIM